VISNQWILTAANCVNFNPVPIFHKVKLGVFMHEKDNEPGEQFLELEEIHIHPKYKPFGAFGKPPVYDVALLKLKTPIQYTDHISPICLPKQQGEGIPPAGTAAFLTGWGWTESSNSGKVSPTLQQVSVPVVSKEKCETFLGGNFSRGTNESVTDVIMCLGFENGGKGACIGDGGGPAVIQDNNGQWTQIGISSFGKNAANGPCTGEYSGYATVSAVIDFIRQYVKDI